MQACIFGGYVRMNVEDRRKAVAELAAEGESNRSIAQALGVGETTVRRDLDAPNGARARDVDEGGGDDDAPNGAPLDLVATLSADEKVHAAAAIDEARARHKEENERIRASRAEAPAGKYRCIVIDPRNGRRRCASGNCRSLGKPRSA
jgi:hypothetical protein